MTMRDIDLVAAPSVPADPAVDDAAYGNTEAAGLIASDTALTDPAMTDTKSYGRPSIGGDFGPGRAAILGADADGGAADLAVDTTVTVETLTIPTPQIIWPGRAANATTRENLYPWFKTPPEGLDQNNPNPPPAPAPPPPPPLPTGVSLPVLQLVGNTGTVQFSGPATRDATVRLRFNIDGGPDQFLDFGILSGDTGTQIAAKVRNGIDAFVGLDATGTGGTVNVIGIGGDLTGFHIEVL
jgi:hypothetical protein